MYSYILNPLNFGTSGKRTDWSVSMDVQAVLNMDKLAWLHMLLSMAAKADLSMDDLRVSRLRGAYFVSKKFLQTVICLKLWILTFMLKRIVII